MSLSVIVIVHCQHPDCPRDFEGDPQDHVDTFGARMEARKFGWTCQPRDGVRVDLCPDHYRSR
jgi:hypothetical protein